MTPRNPTSMRPEGFRNCRGRVFLGMLPSYIILCYQNFYQLCTISDKFIRNSSFFIKVIKKIIYGDAFYWFIPLIKLINY